MMKELAVIGPEYRGAPHPKFDPKCINASELPDNMRPKGWHIDVYKNAPGMCEIVWLTEEPYDKDDLRLFIAAIKQAFKRNGCTGTIKVRVDDRNQVSPTARRTIHI